MTAALALLLFPQDPTAVAAFFRGYDASVVANDPAWTLAHAERTAILRLPGLVTYRDLERRSKAKRGPSAVAACETRIERTRIVGERALVDFTTEVRYRPGVGHAERWKGHAILVWREGGWRLWRLDEAALS